MNTLQAILLGIVQGITEFLPVSSSGHLQIAKELLGVQEETMEIVGGTFGTQYTAVMGGVEWLCQDYTFGSYQISSAAAFIDGQCFYLSAMYTSSNQQAVMTLSNQVLASVRAW